MIAWGLVLALGACGEETSAADALSADVVAADAASADTGEADIAATADVIADADAPSSDTSHVDSGGGKDVSTADGVPADAATTGPCETDTDCPSTPCSSGRCVNAACVAVLQPDGVACDAGDGCSVGATCAAGLCGGGKNGCGCATNDDCAALDDADKCNGALVCVAKAAPDGKAGRCQVDSGSVVSCPPSTDPCLANSCVTATGVCEAKPVVGTPPCEDGDACTGGTHCANGQCGGGEALCACQTTKDCATLADDATWRCTGTWYCDVSGKTPTCKLDTATVVTCPAGAADGCVTATCDVADGSCKPTNKADKSPCEDGNICTGGDHCVAGSCASGPNICKCTKQSDCAKQEDGDLCNGTLYCDVLSPSPTCLVLPGSTVSCDTSADGACKATTCVAKTGACVTNNKTSAGAGSAPTCDDGNPCTSGDSCENGSCAAGTSTCPCTKDADCAAKQPKNQCLGQLYCDLSVKSCVINPATVVVCASAGDTACAHNQCDAKTGACGIVASPDDAPCDADGNPCTAGDVCAKGTCVAGTNVCACGDNDDCAKFEDGDVCNGALFCDTTKLPLRCEVNPKTVISCPTVDDTACTQRVCAKKTGKCPLTPVHELEPCDADGNTCTAGDRCLKGTCLAGTNLCGCQTDTDCAAKEDGDLCNGSLYCDKSAQPFNCKVNPATVVSCNAAIAGPCEVVSCVALSGACTVGADQDNLPCNDGDPCTVGDTCLGGSCQGGNDLCTCKADKDCAQPLDACLGVAVCRNDVVPHVCGIAPGSAVTCNAPGGACFDWACAAGLCVKSAKNGQSSCEDGDPCTAVSSCKGGTCSGVKKSCDDGSACTVDQCDAAGTCTHTAPEGLPCSDGDACTVNDGCKAGKCASGTTATCDDGEPCTTDTCDKLKGCVHAALADKTPCQLPEGLTATCTAGTCATKSP